MRETNVTAKEIAARAVAHRERLAPPMTAPRCGDDHERLIAVLAEVLDAGGADEISPLATLAERIGDLIEAYERESRPIPDAGPVEVLRFLMEQHGLSQADLPEIGAQCVVSAVLAGKRQLNIRQVSALSRRFGVSADAFTP